MSSLSLLLEKVSVWVVFFLPLCSFSRPCPTFPSPPPPSPQNHRTTSSLPCFERVKEWISWEEEGGAGRGGAGRGRGWLMENIRVGNPAQVLKKKTWSLRLCRATPSFHKRKKEVLFRLLRARYTPDSFPHFGSAQQQKKIVRQSSSHFGVCVCVWGQCKNKVSGVGWRRDERNDRWMFFFPGIFLCLYISTSGTDRRERKKEK